MTKFSVIMSRSLDWKIVRCNKRMVVVDIVVVIEVLVVVVAVVAEIVYNKYPLIDLPSCSV